MNRFLGIVLFLTFSLSLFGRDISGVVDSDGKGLKNVVVTDGFNFTQTNENGVLRGTGLLPKREYLIFFIKRYLKLFQSIFFRRKICMILKVFTKMRLTWEI